ncbi:MAG: peptidoglycan DD-metalloendopeptidase family protein [Chitinophagaceae bacterium]|nr:peptidoglycan DD-metalloendopeptidase family protein [Chitinophagaceae bacterium]MCW5927664.1 peptidoglycan DD-metalloendopeptidase family protein [Chitinophagaceae bacterium]
MRNILSLLTAALLFFAVNTTQAQSKEDLEKQRREIQAEIEELRRSQASVKKDRSQSLIQLRRVQTLIKKRDAIIANINKQVQLIDNDIVNNNNEIDRLSRQLDTFKVQYAKTIEHAYKNRSSYDMLNFIFSSASFNDAVKRIAYLKSYREYRGKQLENIQKTQLLLANKNKDLENNKTLKTKTLDEQSKQMLKLEEEKKEKNAVVNQLKEKENELGKQLTTKRKLETNIKNSIAAIIKREIMEAEKAEKARREAAAKAAANKPAATTATTTKATTTRTANKLEDTPEVTAVSVGFENNRRKLPWPVTKGEITGKFGRVKIEGTSLFEENFGVYIRTDLGATVKSVYEGTVSSVHVIGHSSAVTIRHGKYLTTYHNLSNVSVGKGDEIKLGQTIGKAAEDDDEESIGKIYFIVTMVVGSNPKYLNPEDWIKPR